jgi:hypothetical protein
VKDSFPIGVLSNGMLLFGVLFGVAIPELVHYELRWMLMRRASPSAFELWALSLAHEEPNNPLRDVRQRYRFYFYAHLPIH